MALESLTSPQVDRGPIGVVFFCFLFSIDFNVHQDGWILGRFSDGHGVVFLLPGRFAGIMCTVIEKIFILVGNGSFFSTRMLFLKARYAWFRGLKRAVVFKSVCDCEFDPRPRPRPIPMIVLRMPRVQFETS
jgi:hypothetical protein